MEEFNDTARALKDIIEFEPKTTDDYVDNFDIEERMNALFDQLEMKLEGIDNVYAIMAEIPIPIANDDKSALKSLKSSMNSISVGITERWRCSRISSTWRRKRSKNRSTRH